jgi:hypothetical protein
MSAIQPLSPSAWRVSVSALLDPRPWWRRWLAAEPAPRALTAALLVRALEAVAREGGAAGGLRPDRDGLRVVVPHADHRRLRGDLRAVQALLGEVLGLDGPARVELVPDLKGVLGVGEVLVRLVQGSAAPADDPQRTLLARGVMESPPVAMPAGVAPPPPPPAARGSEPARTLLVLDGWDVPEASAVRRPYLEIRCRGEVLGRVPEGRVVTLGRGGEPGAERIVVGSADSRVSRQHLGLCLRPEPTRGTLVPEAGRGGPPAGAVLEVSRPAEANPVAVDGTPLARGASCLVALPASLRLSNGAVCLEVERCLAG